MAHTTGSQRIERVKELLAEAAKIPPEKRPQAEQLPAIGSGEKLICPVITISVDEVVLNPNSHRIKAQLQDDPEWGELENEPYSEQAQRVIQRLVREARTASEFSDLKNSLAKEGQDHPGVITHKGVLVNANTRAVAIREFEDPAQRIIRVAVLPETIQPQELTLLELRLQMRKEFKVDYTLTNELLFIDELSARGLPDRQIAQELRIHPDNPTKGEKEVQTRMRLLDLIHELQQIPGERPPLTFFDEGLEYQQLRELLRERDALIQTDPAKAQQLMERFLLSTAVGVTSVHKLRKIDSSFMDDYMYPQLEEDEELGRFAETLAVGGDEGSDGSAGSNALDLPASEDGQMGEVNLQLLIDAVTGQGKRMKISGTKFSIERSVVKEGVKSAILTGIKEKDRDKRDENKLDAPVTAVKTATKELVTAADAVKGLVDDPEFDLRRKRSLEAAFKKLRKRHRELESTLTDQEVLT